ncbi:MAG: TonB-dependent receptor [Prevotellaceae bacterium]|jgi:TonB-linked SusC/RagA family outer membrane protein|nr:TonB-dependent receptor [Prevotellaceae bacterium]
MKSLFFFNKRFFVASLVLMAASLFGGATLHAQTRTLSGSVTDAQGEILPGAVVVVKGAALSAVADADGRFTLTLPADATAVDVSYIGYITQTVDVRGRDEIKVALQEQVNVFDEVVVIGYGTQKKVNLTGAVQVVAGSNLSKRNAPNTSAALQGLAAGMSVVQSTGKPGSDGGNITIRGRGSINTSTSPLILIDNVEGDINAIDMSIVESISILKDAASASIYGSKAANGVILVTTKRGVEKGVRITYNGYAGFNEPTELATPVSAVDYMKNMNIANINAGGNGIYAEEIIQDLATYGPDNWTVYDTQWRNEMFKKYSLLHKHAVSISSGSDFIRYFATATYQYQDGMIENNNFQRITLRVNSDIKLSEWLKAGLDVSFRQHDTRSPSINTPETLINAGLTLSPILPGINRDGTYGDGQNGFNPIAIARDGGVQDFSVPETAIRFFLTANPIEGMELHGFYNRRMIEDRTIQFIKPYKTYDQGYVKNAYPTASTGERYEAFSKTIHNHFSAQISYEHTFGNHYFKALGGGNAQDYARQDMTARRVGYSFPGYEQLNNGSSVGQTNTGIRTEYAQASLFGRLNYSYASRYLLELDGRYDGSSRFVRGRRWGFFPSVSAGWRASEETFFKPLKNHIDHLKLRASWGSLGNESLSSYYPFASTIATGGYGYMFDDRQLLGGAQIAVANELVSWEKSTQFNVGFDAGLWNNKLTLSFDYFVRQITDMLQSFTIPYMVGLNPAMQNAGDMRVNGWDLTLTWRDKIGEVGYHITANLADALSVVTDLKGKEYAEDDEFIQEGYPLRAFRGYLSDGYYQSEEEIKNAPAYNIRPDDVAAKLRNYHQGDIKYKDISGPNGVPDGMITPEYDRVMVGNPYPRYEFSLDLGAEWNGFDLTVFLQGVGQKDIYLSGQGARPFYNGRSMYTYQTDYWREDNRNAAFPRLLTVASGAVYHNYFMSDFWVKSGAYLRVKNVVLGYTLPKKITQAIRLNRVRVYLSGQNLFTVSNAYEGYDPENTVSNGDFYPVMRTITAGLDIQF